MPKRIVLSAKKYRINLNEHLIGEMFDRMQLSAPARGVVVRGLNSIKLALARAKEDPSNFSVTITELVRGDQKLHAPIKLFELMFILDDPEALADVYEYGNHFVPSFGPKTQAAVRAFAEAVCVEADRGFFRY